MGDPQLRVHTVKPGDTLAHISLSYYHRRDYWPFIAKYNHLVDGNQIVVGQKLKIWSIEYINKIAAQSSTASSRPTKKFLPISHFAADAGAETIKIPPWTHSFRDLVIFKGPAGAYYVVAKMTADVTLKIKDKTLDHLDLSKEGLGITSEYDSRFAKLSSGFKFKLTKNKGVQISNGFTTSTTINGEEFYSTEMKVIPPKTFSYTVSPKEIKGEAQGCEFSGKIGFCLELTLQDDVQTQPTPQPNPDWVPIILAVPAVRGTIGVVEFLGSTLAEGVSAVAGLFIVTPLMDPNSGQYLDQGAGRRIY